MSQPSSLAQRDFMDDLCLSVMKNRISAKCHFIARKEPALFVFCMVIVGELSESVLQRLGLIFAQ